MPRLILFILFCAFLLAPNIYAQSPQEQYTSENINQRNFDEKKYTELTKGVDYSEEEYKRKERKESDALRFEGLGPLLKFILIALGIGLLVFILIKALSDNNLFSPKDKKFKPVGEIDLEKIEDNLENAELNHPIQQAIAADNYPLAIRLYYLAILQELHLSKKIKWKKDKTNGEYLRELAGTPLFKDMQNITLIFERIWYGEIQIEKEDFLKIEPQFQKLLKPKSTTT